MRRGPIFLTLLFSLAHCGGRSSLRVTEENDRPSEPSPLATSRIVTLSSVVFNAQSQLVGINDMSGAGYATDLVGGDLLRACHPVFDRQGRLVFADGGDQTNRVLRLDRDTGELDVLSTADFAGPPGLSFGGITLDDADRIYGSDFFSSRIIRIDDLTGAGWTTFGETGDGVGQFFEPRGVAMTPSGGLVIADTGNARVVQIDDLSGAGWKEWHPPVIPGRTVATPWQVAMDDAGRIYVTDVDAFALHRIDSIEGDGLVTYVALPQLSHVTIAADGRIYLGMSNGKNALAAMDDMQGTGFELYQGPAGDELQNPCGVAVR